jgi:hypothetical protein
MCNFIVRTIENRKTEEAAAEIATVWQNFYDLAQGPDQYQIETHAKSSPELFAFMTDWLREALKDERFVKLLEYSYFCSYLYFQFGNNFNLCSFAMKNPSPRIALDTLEKVSKESEIRGPLVARAMESEYEVKKIAFLANFLHNYSLDEVSYDEALAVTRIVNKGKCDDWFFEHSQETIKYAEIWGGTIFWYNPDSCVWERGSCEKGEISLLAA